MSARHTPHTKLFLTAYQGLSKSYEPNGKSIWTQAVNLRPSSGSPGATSVQQDINEFRKCTHLTLLTSERSPVLRTTAAHLLMNRLQDIIKHNLFYLEIKLLILKCFPNLNQSINLEIYWGSTKICFDIFQRKRTEWLTGNKVSKLSATPLILYLGSRTRLCKNVNYSQIHQTMTVTARKTS